MRRAALLLVAAVAALSASSAHATIVISSDRGGLISDYAARFLSARDFRRAGGDRRRMPVGLHARRRHGAAGQGLRHAEGRARLPLGVAAEGSGKRANSAVASQAMLDVYPAELRKWIAQRGGLNSRMIFLYGRELAEIVPPCTSAVIASISGTSKAPHQAHVVKADTTRAALVARQGR